MFLFAIRKYVQSLVFTLLVALLLVLDVGNVYALMSDTPLLRVHVLHNGLLYSNCPSNCDILCMIEVHVS
jgi:hypothetical protein